MKNTGYVIAKNRELDLFFTATSSYDRPRWTPVSESTIYYSAEMADAAALKVAKQSGAYSCKVVQLSEAIGPEVDTNIAEPALNKSNGMTAASTDEVCDNCDHAPCTCDTDSDGIDDLIDAELGMDDTTELSDADGEFDEDTDDAGMSDDGIPAENPDNMPNTAIGLSAKGDELARRLPRRMGGLGESAEKVELIKFNTPSGVADKPDTDLTNSGAQPHDDKVKVPADVIRELKATIKQFDDDAEKSNTHDDTRAAFCLTVSSALTQLLNDLELGTVQGVKQAQIHMTSYMSPITANLPAIVQRYIVMGGRKPTLQDIFNDKRSK